ncbi:MAG: hypothetical protein Roseis2KO_09130 [Roseivirga sp.]
MYYEPTHIYYMNTIQCNQRCTKCSHWKYKDKNERLPVKNIIDAIRAIKTAKELCIVGGEPLLFKNEIYGILSGISKTQVRTVIITNGVPMDEQFIERIKQYNIHIVVSIDTVDRGFWKFVRGTNSYDRVFSNIEIAIKRLAPTQLSIQSVLSEETQSHMTAVADYANNRNLYHSIQDYIAEGFEGSWTPVEKKHAKIPTYGQKCFAADRNLSIMQNGDVHTCFQQNWIEDCALALGNLNTETIDKILMKSYTKMVSQKMRICDLPCKVLKCNTQN